MKSKTNKTLLKKEIKQIKSVICAFKYKYFCPLDPLVEADLEKFEEFRRETLFKLVDQWKKMELELMAEDGRV